VLIAEDNVMCRLLLQTMLSRYGECHVAVNGREALTAFHMAQDEGRPYNLICLDIMMPEIDGLTVLAEIRRCEASKGIQAADGVKIIMTTALSEEDKVLTAVRAPCNAYLLKPIDRARLLGHLRSFGLISPRRESFHSSSGQK
jgi:two-component system chemotaxis response regulator CheY